MNKPNKIIICDIDNTVAVANNRHHFDWTSVDSDDPISSTIDLIKGVISEDSLGLVFLTGRNEGYTKPIKTKPEIKNYETICRDLTVKWLKDYFGNYTDLIMKPADSYEKAAPFKLREIQRLVEKYEVFCMFDDDESVNKLVREHYNFPIYQII